MKYKICRREVRKLRILCGENNTRPTELTTQIQYYAKRKGKIFGFWHDVGEENYDYNGDTWITEEYFNNPDDCIDFVKKFHIYHYGHKNKCEIINTLTL